MDFVRLIVRKPTNLDQLLKKWAVWGRSPGFLDSSPMRSASEQIRHQAVNVSGRDRCHQGERDIQGKNPVRGQTSHGSHSRQSRGGARDEKGQGCRGAHPGGQQGNEHGQGGQIAGVGRSEYPYSPTILTSTRFRRRPSNSRVSHPADTRSAPTCQRFW